MGSWKVEQELAQAGLPELLRALADALEGGAAGGLLHGLPAQDLRKLVLVAERKDSGLSVKLKAKRAGETLVPTARTGGHKDEAPAARKAQDRSQAKRDKYRQLKKALQADFKTLEAAAHAGRLPGAEVLESFLGLAEGMGQGGQPVLGAARAEMARADAAFLDDCQALRRAFAARDAAALVSALERLARRKTACHAQFRQ